MSSEDTKDATPELSSEVQAELGTMFILEVMRQKRDEVMRLKKDQLINEMARKQREQRERGHAGGAGNACNDGTGFMGVPKQQTSATSAPRPTFRWKKRVPPSEAADEQAPPAMNAEQAELFIMGMIKEEREERALKDHQVYEEQIAVPSQKKSRQKFENA